jgi:hypothetical protein
MAKGEGISSLTFPYLKIGYTDADGSSANVWINLPELDDPQPTEEPVETPEPTPTPTPTPQLTAAELEEVLLTQPMYVESTKYVVQDARYKALYPDMLQAVFRNNSGTDVKNAVLAFVAWDSNGFPVKIEGKHMLGNALYLVEATYSDVNMVDGSTYGSDCGFSLASDTDNISTFKAIVVSYDDFDGNTWENPYYDTWIEIYVNQKLQ